MTQIRELDATDAEALRVFLGRVPEGERRWFKDDVLDPTVVESWVRDTRARRLVVESGDGLAAYAAVTPGRGWSSHVGELTLIVDPDARRRGIGRSLGRRAVADALRAGLRKVVVEVVADQTSAVDMFAGLGFDPEALLRDHVRDRQGQFHDLLILAHPVGETWGVMAATGVEDAVT